MTNLKEETLSSIKSEDKNISDIDYCYVLENACSWDETKANVLLKGAFDENRLNFTYDDGYGSQEIFGFIVFKDGTWLERDEYDGSEWWDFKSKPTLN